MAINAEREGLFEFRDFRGLRNTVDSRDFSPDDLEAALNVDIDDGQNVTRRKGFSTVVVAGVDRSLFAAGPICLGVGSNTLKQIAPNYATISLRTGLTPLRELTYSAIGNRVYYANGVELGVVENAQSRSWGLPVPPAPVLAATGGDLKAGRYQVVVTYLRNDDQESGAGLASVIELTTISGIAISSIPVSTDSTVTHKNIYVTSTDGATLYRAGTILNAATTFTVASQVNQSGLLTTQFLTAPPAGDFITYWNGHMLVARGNLLYRSEPYSPELFDLRKVVPLLGQVTMVAAVPRKADGVWIGTDQQIIYLSGDAPEAWTYEAVADYGVIPGTVAFGDGELLGDGSARGESIAMFATKQGLCVGRQGGSLINLTGDRFNYPVMDRGAGIIRRHRGMAQYLTVLQGAETQGNIYS